MALINDVKALCNRLGPLGWRDLFLAVTKNTLDISQPTAAKLRTALTAPIPAIDRTLPGFEDFHPAGAKAITAGKPADSLLYHAMASPLVVRDHRGKLLGGFPTPLELETLENFIFSLSADSLSNLIAANGGISKVAFAVFASEYRPAADTVDGRHADLVFSRTGVARVGTARAQYLPESRGYWPEDADNPSRVRVMPAKFSVWLAVKKKGNTSRVSPILDNESGQAAEEPSRDFWIPAHKIFSGSECLSGTALTVTFRRRLLNVKIQKVQESLGTSPLPGGFPYVLEDSVIADFSTDLKDGTGCLIPTVHPSLVAPAMQDGKPVTYRVTPGKVQDFAAFEPGEGYPSYVHARTRIGANGTAEDLNEETNIIKAMKAKPYKALHYVDFTGEGWIAAELTGLPGNTPSVLAAYTLISAPDFFPASGQFELSEWSRSPAIPAAFRGKLWNINPTPLSEIRFPANLQLPGTPFTAADNTITAVVSMGAPLGQAPVWPVQPDPLRATALPDDAAGVFAPGWDVGQDSTGTTEHLAAYSLGSPFPEDAKLCAALSTFWPAVAPDIFRTFVQVPGNVNGTVAPLTDAEIGQTGGLPWDGVPGPRVVDAGGEKKVEYAAFLNADYVRLALQNRFSIRHTARLTAEDYQSRIIAACRVYNVLAELGDFADARNQWLMLSFVKVEAGNTALHQAQTEAGHILAGRVYGVKMCRMSNQRERVNAKTERMPLIDLTEFFVSASDVLALHKPAGAPRFIRTRSE
jgi:hypothetical protein